MNKVTEIILNETGFKSIPELKKHLKSIAKYQYGCYYAEIKKPTFKVSYTSNPNCFASYLVSLNMVGMTKQLALDKESITDEGLKRGCGEFYLKP
jgi:hypothetical protein